MRTSSLHRVLQKFVKVKESEVSSLSSGFGALCCTLGAYFLVLPLRDEAGLALGTDLFPTLFSCSFVLTLVATPLASAFSSRPNTSRSRAAQQLFSLFALSLLAFFLLYHAVSTQQPQQQIFSETDHANRQLQQQDLSQLHSNSTAQSTTQTQAKTGDPNLSGAQKAVRIGFYLWLSLLNLLATSTLWARAADAFDSSAAARLFGFLGAGATLGQLAGSITAATWASLPALTPASTPSSTPTGPPFAMLLVSASLLEAAGRLAAAMQCSDTFSTEAVHYKKAEPDRPESDHAHAHSRHASSSISQSHGKPSQRGTKAVQKNSGNTWGTCDLSGAHQGLSQLFEGFRLIAKSGYLCHVCLHFVMHYLISTFFYFEKTLVVASSGGSASQRVATFATINSMSAGAVALIQLTATGKMLSQLGVAWCLTAGPLVAAALMTATALFPNTYMIGFGEIVRKVSNHCLARPAREILYTVIPTEEKYKAKVCIDTIVVRMGDSIGAGMFRMLDSLLGFGPSGLAATAAPVCLLWSAITFRLGQRQQQMSVQRGFEH